MKQRFVSRPNDIKLAVYDYGPVGKAPTILLVHGYPDNANVWKAVVDKLSQQFHVVTYDVRGAGHSSKPRQTAAYSLPQLYEDLIAVAQAVSPKRPVHLVGHDWGAVQGWHAVSQLQCNAHLASFTSISGLGLDHIGDWVQQMLGLKSITSLKLLASRALHSWYVGLFHLPWLAPAAWQLGLGRLWPQLLARAEGISPPAADPLTASDGSLGIKLYRANVLPRLKAPRPAFARIPVQMLVGRHDPFVLPQLLQDLRHWAPQLTWHECDGGHWLPLSHSEWLALHIANFVSTQPK